MEKKIINTDNAPKAIGPYSHSVLAGNTLYVSGQVPLNPVTGALEMDSIETQTHQCLKNVKAILEAADMGFANVVKATVFITDMAQFANINAVYGEYFTENYPARECVQVAALPRGVNVEISVIAVK